jgi:RNA polymerase primary sigma factor
MKTTKLRSTRSTAPRATQSLNIAPGQATDPSTNSRPKREASEDEVDQDVAIKKWADRAARTPVSLYLQEIGQVALLTVEEEIELAARIKNGDEAAREHMIRANLRLVVKIARDYDNLGLPLLDLVNEGNMGLMKAVDRFDPAKGGKFSTYGSYWIKQAIKRALANQSKVIRLPVHVQERLFRMRKTQHKWQEIYGRNPDSHELSQELGLGSRIIQRMERASISMNSLDAPLGEDDSTRLGDIVKDERMPTAFEEYDQKMMHGLVTEKLSSLNERELTIINERFGLDGGPGKTLEEIADMFGLTRERIRQLQNIALSKLREQLEELDRPKNQSLAA